MRTGASRSGTGISIFSRMPSSAWRGPGLTGASHQWPSLSAGGTTGLPRAQPWLRLRAHVAPQGCGQPAVPVSGCPLRWLCSVAQARKGSGMGLRGVVCRMMTRCPWEAAVKGEARTGLDRGRGGRAAPWTGPRGGLEAASRPGGRWPASTHLSLQGPVTGPGAQAGRWSGLGLAACCRAGTRGGSLQTLSGGRWPSLGPLARPPRGHSPPPPPTEVGKCFGGKQCKNLNYWTCKVTLLWDLQYRKRVTGHPRGQAIPSQPGAGGPVPQGPRSLRASQDQSTGQRAEGRGNEPCLY